MSNPQRTAAQIAQDANKASDGKFQSVTNAEAGIALDQDEYAMFDRAANCLPGIHALSNTAVASEKLGVEIYTRTLADLVKEAYPEADRIEYAFHSDAVYGRTAKFSAVRDAEGKAIDVDQKFFGSLGAGAMVDEVNPELLEETLEYSEGNEDVSFLNLAGHQAADQLDRVAITKDYRQQLAESLRTLEFQAAQAEAVMIADTVAELVPNAKSMMISEETSGRYNTVARITTDEGVFTNPYAVAVKGDPGNVPWELFGTMSPEVSYSGIAGHELNMEELRNWVPGQELTKS